MAGTPTTWIGAANPGSTSAGSWSMARLCRVSIPRTGPTKGRRSRTGPFNHGTRSIGIRIPMRRALAGSRRCVPVPRGARAATTIAWSASTVLTEMATPKRIRVRTTSPAAFCGLVTPGRQCPRCVRTLSCWLAAGTPIPERVVPHRCSSHRGRVTSSWKIFTCGHMRRPGDLREPALYGRTPLAPIALPGPNRLRGGDGASAWRPSRGCRGR